MKLKDQKILDRQIAKKDLEKVKAIQEYVDNLTLEKQTTLQNMIENVKIYCQQNPNEPVFMAEIFEAKDLKKFLFEEKADAKTLAKVLYDYGGICFVDQNCTPIDGRNAKIIEITKTVEIPVKKADAPLSQNKLDKIIKKTLYEFKGKNPMMTEGASQFCETFLKELSKI